MNNDNLINSKCKSLHKVVKKNNSNDMFKKLINPSLSKLKSFNSNSIISKNSTNYITNKNNFSEVYENDYKTLKEKYNYLKCERKLNEQKQKDILNNLKIIKINNNKSISKKIKEDNSIKRFNNIKTSSDKYKNILCNLKVKQKIEKEYKKQSINYKSRDQSYKIMLKTKNKTYLNNNITSEINSTACNNKEDKNENILKSPYTIRNNNKAKDYLLHKIKHEMLLINNINNNINKI